MENIKKIYIVMYKKIYLFLLVALCGAMINPAVAKKKKQEESFYGSYDKKEREERN